jgi:hypothetical protein
VHTGSWWEDLREGNHLEDPGIDGRRILKWILKKCNGGHGLYWSSSGEGQVVGACEFHNEPLDSIKCREFLD